MNDNQHQDEEEEIEIEEECEEEQEEDQSGDLQDDQEENTKEDGKASVSMVPKIKETSKKITKKDDEQTYIELGKTHPNKWRELVYLKKIIEGKEFEIKLLRMKYEKKFKRFTALKKPDSPQPGDYVLSLQM